MKIITLLTSISQISAQINKFDQRRGGRPKPKVGRFPKVGRGLPRASGNFPSIGLLEIISKN